MLIGMVFVNSVIPPSSILLAISLALIFERMPPKQNELGVASGSKSSIAGSARLSNDPSESDGRELAQTSIVPPSKKRAVASPVVPSGRDSFRKRVFFFVDEPDSSFPALIYMYLIYLLVLVSTISVLMQTVQSTEWNELEHVIGVILFVDLALRLFASSRFLSNGYNFLEILNTLPYIVFLFISPEERASNDNVVSFIWLMRVVLRLLKITRYSTDFALLMSSVRLSAESLVTPSFFLMVLCVTFAVFVLFFEQDSGTDMFNSIFDGIWFSLVSLSTTGYGDKFPITAAGKIFTGVFLVIGILYTAIPIAIIGSNFSDVWTCRDEILVVQRTKQRLSDLGIKEHDVKQAFRVFDTDGSGEISIDEFRQLISVLRVGISDKKIYSLFRAFDKDSSGNISYAEFAKTIFPSTIFTKEELEKQAAELETKQQAVQKASAAINLKKSGKHGVPAQHADVMNRRLLKNVEKFNKHGRHRGIVRAPVNPNFLYFSSHDEAKAKINDFLDSLLGNVEKKVGIYREALAKSSVPRDETAAIKSSFVSAQGQFAACITSDLDHRPVSDSSHSEASKKKPYIPPVGLPKQDAPAFPNRPDLADDSGSSQSEEHVKSLSTVQDLRSAGIPLNSSAPFETEQIDGRLPLLTVASPPVPVRATLSLSVIPDAQIEAEYPTAPQGESQFEANDLRPPGVLEVSTSLNFFSSPSRRHRRLAGTQSSPVNVMTHARNVGVIASADLLPLIRPQTGSDADLSLAGYPRNNAGSRDASLFRQSSPVPGTVIPREIRTPPQPKSEREQPEPPQTYDQQ